jgi:hypothetical protein
MTIKVMYTPSVDETPGGATKIPVPYVLLIDNEVFHGLQEGKPFTTLKANQYEVFKHEPNGD